MLKVSVSLSLLKAIPCAAIVCTAIACVAIVVVSSVLTCSASAQAVPAATGSISGTLVDPQGALITQATVTITRAGGEPAVAKVDELGRFAIANLAPGLYTVEASSPGFRTVRKPGLAVTGGTVQRLTLTLAIEEQQQQVTVSADDNEVDSAPEKNGGAIVLKGKDLSALSDDQNELQQQLEAIAGSDPEAGSQFYVDGFSGGKLPPKSSIREIRINQNPYSAQYDQLGFGRIEIFTKPGTDKLHGETWMQGNDSPFNGRNPFVTEQPGYYTYQFDGDVNGPLSKAASFFTSVYGQFGDTDSVVNAVVLDNALNQANFTQAISSPTTLLNFGQRVDLQVGKAQTLNFRYQLERTTQTNAGVGQLALASQAYNMDNVEQVLQFSDTQAYGAKVVNETRFQYIRDRNSQVAVNQAPTLAVQGAFTGGGSSLGTIRDKQDHYELQDYVQMDVGNHDIHFGGRFRGVRDSNYSTANFNGQYTFASLTAYQITEQNLGKLTPAQIRALGGGASQYSQTVGKPGIAVSLLDTGLYGEDNWKLKPNLTISYGLRFETQTDIHDHADWGPRFSVARTIDGGKNKPPRAVIRGGAGWFYQRFASTNVLQADRQNGVTQSQYVVNQPDFFPADCVTTPSSCTGLKTMAAGSAPTIYQISPTLRSPYIFMTGVGVDKPIGKVATISANYMYSRGEHLFLTRNINAPLPGTYDPTNPDSGTRPLGIDENIYQYDSDGTSARNRLVINGNMHVKKAGFFGYYMLSKMETNTAGVASFPSNQYDLHVDYGRGANDIRSRLFMGGFMQLPGKISINPFIIAQSGAPFNITTGEDLNGDTQFNDRPAFATDLTRPSVYKTKYGNFDAMPIVGQTIIPINYGHGPSLFIANLRLNRSFAFGPIIPDDPQPPSSPDEKTDKKPDAKPPAKPVKKEIERKYTVGVGIASDNIFNHVNLGPPIGVLSSPLFGTSNSLATVFGNGTSNRTVNLEMFFHF